MDYTSINVIGLDLDQTLYPKSPEIDEAIQKYLYRKISEHLKVSLKEAEKKFRDLYQSGKGLSGSKTMEALDVPDPKETVQEALEKAGIAKFLKPDKKVLALLSALKKKYKNLDLITGSGEKITLKKLSRLGIEKTLFNHIITADQASKPDLSAFKMWLNFYPRFSAENFLYIGDRPFSDFQSPASLGISAILVNQKSPDPALDCPQLPNLFELEKILLP